MPNHLAYNYSEEQIGQMIQSWLAYSATSIIFAPDKDPCVLLGLRKVPAVSIPEPGDYCLIGGFNTVVSGPANLEAVANAHVKAQIGIDVHARQCSPFLPCEYDMGKITEPLKTPFGDLAIKRMAFDRIVFLTGEQQEAIDGLHNGHEPFPPGSKLKGIQWITHSEFRALEDTGKLSFPYQVDHVLEGFDWASREKLPQMVSWS